MPCHATWHQEIINSFTLRGPVRYHRPTAGCMNLNTQNKTSLYLILNLDCQSSFFGQPTPRTQKTSETATLPLVCLELIAYYELRRKP